MTDAFDSDVLIYAANLHPLGPPIRALFDDRDAPVGVGSWLLVPEVTAKPRRLGRHAELGSIVELLACLDLRPLDAATAEAAAQLGATYNLRAPDAVHLATAILAGADRFITNNRRDFSTAIAEIAVTYPDEL